MFRCAHDLRSCSSSRLPHAACRSTLRSPSQTTSASGCRLVLAHFPSTVAPLDAMACTEVNARLRVRLSIDKHRKRGRDWTVPRACYSRSHSCSLAPLSYPDEPNAALPSVDGSSPPGRPASPTCPTSPPKRTCCAATRAKPRCCPPTEVDGQPSPLAGRLATDQWRPRVFANRRRRARVRALLPPMPQACCILQPIVRFGAFPLRAGLPTTEVASSPSPSLSRTAKTPRRTLHTYSRAATSRSSLLPPCRFRRLRVLVPPRQTVSGCARQRHTTTTLGSEALLRSCVRNATPPFPASATPCPSWAFSLPRAAERSSELEPSAQGAGVLHFLPPCSAREHRLCRGLPPRLGQTRLPPLRASQSVLPDIVVNDVVRGESWCTGEPDARAACAALHMKAWLLPLVKPLLELPRTAGYTASSVYTARTHAPCGARDLTASTTTPTTLGYRPSTVARNSTSRYAAA